MFFEWRVEQTLTVWQAALIPPIEAGYNLLKNQTTIIGIRRDPNWAPRWKVT